MASLKLQPGWCGALIFVALGCSVLPYAGVQTDEALFGASLYQSNTVIDKFRAFGHDVPTMPMSYLGALKSWVYAPVFAVWPPSLWSIRLPMVLLGACTILLFARLLDRLYGRMAAWVGVALLATDTSLVMTTTFDWGPVAIQHFLSVALAWWLLRFAREDRWWMLALAAFLAGLALWNKAVFAWTLMGAGTALLALFPVEIWRRLSWRNVAVAVLFFAGGASMLIRYNVRHSGETWRSTARMSLANIADKHIHVRSLLEGSALMGFMIAEDNYPTTRFTVMPYVCLAGALAALAWRRRGLAFPLLAAILTWLAMAVTKDGGGSVHHAVLIYPLPQWMLAAVAAAAAGLWPARAWLVLAMAGLLAADNARLVLVHRDDGQRLGGGEDWNEAILPLAASVKRRNPAEVRMYDWGLQDNVILLTARSWNISYPERPFGEAAFTQSPDALWIGRVNERLPGINTELFAAAEKYGYQRVVLERFANKRGVPAFELFEFRKKQTP